MPKKTLEVFEVVHFCFPNGWMAAKACERLQAIVMAHQGAGSDPVEVVFRVPKGTAHILIGSYLHPFGSLIDAWEISTKSENNNW